MKWSRGLSLPQDLIDRVDDHIKNGWTLYATRAELIRSVIEKWLDRYGENII